MMTACLLAFMWGWKWALHECSEDQNVDSFSTTMPTWRVAFFFRRGFLLSPVNKLISWRQARVKNAILIGKDF